MRVKYYINILYSNIIEFELITSNRLESLGSIYFLSSLCEWKNKETNNPLI